MAIEPPLFLIGDGCMKSGCMFAALPRNTRASILESASQVRQQLNPNNLRKAESSSTSADANTQSSHIFARSGTFKAMIPSKKSRLSFKVIQRPESPANVPDWVKSVDLYTLDDHGNFNVANRPSLSELETELRAFNHAFYCYRNEPLSEYGALSLLRCDERISPEQSHRALPSTLTVPDTSRARSRASSIHSDISRNQENWNPIDLKELSKFFDRCRQSDSEEFELSLMQRQPHCRWSCTRHSSPARPVNCVKFSYSLVSPDGPSLNVSHHFHSLLVSHDEAVNQNLFPMCVDGDRHLSLSNLTNAAKQANLVPSPPTPDRVEEDKVQYASDSLDQSETATEASLQDRFREMARGYTMGLGSKDLEDILLKAKKLDFVEGHKSQWKTSTTFRPTLHPKAIVLGVLEAFASDLRWSITSHQNFIEDQEDQIRVQRQPKYKNGDGLARCSTFLSEVNVKIGLLRPKELFLAASISTLESCRGIPESEEDLAFLFPAKTVSDAPVSNSKNPFEEQWRRQLDDIHARLRDLKGKCDHCKADLETLQHQVTGNLLMLSNLLAQRENEWTHDTAQYQIDMLEKQEIILQKQEIIAKKAKLDGTVTKWIAILTALLLPGTFVAILFTIPIFNWDAPDKKWVKPEPFELYWKVTGSVTGVFVAGFSIWFLALWLWDRKSKPVEGKDGGTAAVGEKGERGAAESRNRQSSFQAMLSGRRRSKSPGLPTVQA